MQSEKCANLHDKFESVSNIWEDLVAALPVPENLRLKVEKLLTEGKSKDLAEVLMIAARSMRKNGDISMAIESYYKAWELDQTKEEAIWFVVRNSKPRDREYYAKTIADITTRKYPDSRAALIAQAVEAEANGNRQKMIEVLERAVKTHPNQMIYLQLIAGLRAQGETERAIAISDEGIEAFPESDRIATAKSDLLSTGVDPAQAASSWEALGKKSQQLKPLAEINEARIYRKSGNPDLAIEKYENLLDEYGPTSESVRALVVLYCSQNRFELARSAIERGKGAIAPDLERALTAHIGIKSESDRRDWQSILKESLRSYPRSLEIYDCLFENFRSPEDVTHYLERIIEIIDGDSRVELDYMKRFIDLYIEKARTHDKNWLNSINFTRKFREKLTVESASILISAYIRNKDFCRASAQLTDSISFHSDDPRLSHLQALLAFNMGDLEKADEIWRALETIPRFWKRAAEFRAKVALALNDRGTAISQYEALWNRYPEHDEASIFLLRDRLSAGKIPEAVAIQSKIERVRKEQPVVWRSRAILAVYSDGEEAALKILEKALPHYPDRLDIRLLLIDIARNANRMVDALSHALSSIEKFPDDRRLLVRALDLLQLDGEYDQQLALIDNYFSHSGDDPELLLRRARVSLSLGDRVEAIRDCSRGLLLYPRSVELWQLKIAALLNQNDPRAAETECNRAIANFDPQDESDLVSRADLLLSAERYEDAIKSASIAVKGNNALTRAHIILAKAYEALGNWKVSLSHYSSLLEYPEERKRIAATVSRLSFAVSYRVQNPVDGPVDEAVKTSATNLYPELLFESACQKHMADTYRCSSKSVLHVTSSLGPGGAERQLTNTTIAQNAVRSGYSPSIAATSLSAVGERNFYLKRCESEDIPVCELDNVFASGAARNLMAQCSDHAKNLQFCASLPIDAARLAIPLYCEIIDKKPTVLHLWQDTTCVAGGIVGLLAGVPAIVLSTRSTRPIERQRYRRYLKPAFLELLKKANVTMINNSANGASDYAQWLGIDPKFISTVYNGYDFGSMKKRAASAQVADSRSAVGISEGDFVLGGVMRLSNEKRPNLWLDAAVDLVQAREKCVAVLVGDGPMRAQLANRIEELGLSHQIKLLGTKNPVEPWISMMDVLLLTSETEGLPNVLIEAQALGTPVVSVDVGGARETLRLGKTGLLAESASTGYELAGKIGTLIDDDQLRNRMAHVGIEMTAEKFSMDRTVACFENIYDTLVGQSA